MNTARMLQARALIDQVHTAGGSIRLNGQKVKVLAVPANLLPALRAFKPEILALLTPPPAIPQPITSRPIVRFTLTRGAGVILGQQDDTAATLLAVLRDKWPHELTAAWFDGGQIQL
jgi:hypothetical protein